MTDKSFNTRAYHGDLVRLLGIQYLSFLSLQSSTEKSKQLQALGGDKTLPKLVLPSGE